MLFNGSGIRNKMIKRKSKNKNVTPTMFELQTDIKHLFKAYCAARGKTMLEVIENFMLETIRKG